MPNTEQITQITESVAEVLINARITSAGYDPSLFNITNVSASSANHCDYIKTFDNILVTGSVNITTTLAVATVLDISLPYNAFAPSVTNLNGVATFGSAFGTNGYLELNIVDNRARLKFIGLSVGGSGTVYFSFMYKTP